MIYLLIVEWIQDGKTIEESNSHYQLVKESSKKYSLTIPSTAISDIGQYAVKLSDKTGETSAAFSLNILTEENV